MVGLGPLSQVGVLRILRQTDRLRSRLWSRVFASRVRGLPLLAAYLSLERSATRLFITVQAAKLYAADNPDASFIFQPQSEASHAPPAAQ